MEDALIRTVEGLKGEYVGRYTCDGERVYYTYLPDDESPDALAMGLKQTSYDLEVEAAFDPQCERYRIVLYPSAEELCCMKNRCMLEAMRATGVDLSVSMRVDHWLYFPTRDARLDAKREVASQQFSVKDCMKNAGEGHLIWGLHLIGNHVMERDTIDGVSLALMRVAERFQGQYDGWGVDLGGVARSSSSAA